ncbi:hypothetical protein LAG73_16460 [Pseudoxanthomonas japonensis]|nr:hypothetical protein LAG73_16460 [Pseudoxanthomonas japonensis]
MTCRDCHKPKYHFGSGRCEDCAWRRIHSRLLTRLYAEVPAAWARELMTEYYQTLRDQISHGTLSKSLRHDVSFFSALSSHFASAEALSGVLVVRKLGHEFLARYGRVMSFLNVTGHITTYEDPDYLLEWHLSRIRSYTTRGPAWSHAALDRFLTHMLHKRDLSLDRGKRRTVPVKPKSMESAVRAAVAFLAFAAAEGATSLPEVSQEHLELFLGRHRNYRLRIRAFVRYLRRHERRFQKLSVPASKSEFSLKHALSDEARWAHIDCFAQASTTVDVRWSLISLFALIYAHPLGHLWALDQWQAHDLARSDHHVPRAMGALRTGLAAHSDRCIGDQPRHGHHVLPAIGYAYASARAARFRREGLIDVVCLPARVHRWIDVHRHCHRC